MSRVLLSHRISVNHHRQMLRSEPIRKVVHRSSPASMTWCSAPNVAAPLFWSLALFFDVINRLASSAEQANQIDLSYRNMLSLVLEKLVGIHPFHFKHGPKIHRNSSQDIIIGHPPITTLPPSQTPGISDQDRPLFRFVINGVRSFEIVVVTDCNYSVPPFNRIPLRRIRDFTGFTGIPNRTENGKSENRWKSGCQISFNPTQ